MYGREIDKYMIRGYFNASYSLADRINIKEKTSKYRKKFNNVVSKLDPTEILATPVENTFFQKLLEYPCLVTQSCLILFVTPWTVAHQVPLSVGILQARILEWDATPSSKESSQTRDGTQVSHIAGRFFTN